MYEWDSGQFFTDLQKLAIFFGVLWLYFHWICNILRKHYGIDYDF